MYTQYWGAPQISVDFIIGTKQESYQPSKSEQELYRNKGLLRLAGSLLWIARQCHAEISFAASQVTSVMSMPSKVAWDAALGTLRWLVEHCDQGLLYREQYSETIVSRDGVHQLDARTLHGHTDSGHGTYDDGRAHGGHAIYLAGGPVTFTSKKLDIVTDSTLYSEYVQLHQSDH